VGEAVAVVGGQEVLHWNEQEVVAVAGVAAEMVQQRVKEVRELEAAGVRRGLNLEDGQGVEAERDF
jgi:hypothetical protein